MNPECYTRGECIKCGCMTTNLQMASKACEGNCYPKFISAGRWEVFKQLKSFIVDDYKWELRNSPSDINKLIYVRIKKIV
jgi:hypothetical protein